MNMLKLIKSVAICLMLVLNFGAKSQISYDGVVKGLHSYVNNDSLKGFDEQFYKQDALQRGFFGTEYNVYMYQSKKAYIAKKYNLNTNQNPYGSNLKPGPATINAAPCVNEDFEAGNFTGWTVSQGQNVSTGGSCTMAGCCPSVSINSWIRTTPYAGPLPLGVIPASPLGGTQVAQLNDMVWNQGEIVRIQQTFPVTSGNALFQFAYLAAMDGSGHLCCDQPFMKITLLNCANQPLACPSVSITPPGASCASSVPSGWVTNTSGVSYTTSWQISSLDLTPYIGSCVTVQVTVGDCTGWAHAGMAYFDAVCKPITLQVNNNFFPAGTNAFVVSSCGTNTAVMTAPAGLGPYLWNGPGGSGITNNANQVITTTTPGAYTLTMNPPGSCAPIVKTVTLTIGTNPNSGFTTTNACNNYTFTNTGSGPPSIQTYSFMGTGAPASYTTTSPTSSVVFTPGTYTVQQVVTNTVGCTSTATQVINVTGGPTLTVNSPSVCPGTTANLSVSGATTYTWSGPGLSNPNISNPTANPNVTTTYTVSGTTAGCTSTTTLVVTALPVPTITTTSAVMCSGSSSVITASGANTYVWSPSVGLSNPNIFNPTASPVSTTVYTVTGTDSNGCLSSQTSVVTINPLPIISVTSATTCSGIPVTITASGANTYTWSTGGLTNSITQAPVVQTTYTVTGTDVNGCVNFNISTIAVSYPFTVSISNNSPICQGYDVNMSVPQGFSYNWSGPNGFSSNVSNPTINNAQPIVSGQYTVVVTDVGGCTGIAYADVVVNSTPIVSISSSNDGMCAPGCVTFTVSSTNAIGTIDWLFTNGGHSSSNVTTQCFNKGGIYTSTVTIVDTKGCQGASTSTTQIYSVPVADFVFAPLKPIYTEEVNFTDASYGANITNWYWYFNSQSINSTLQNPTTIYEIGTYPVTLVVKSDKGCMDTITKVIVVGEDYGIYVPNTFTPNGDGLNDTFQPKGFGIVKYQLQIFDRWGEMIYETKTFENGWDGKVHKGIDYGVICKNDVYVWRITLTNVFGKAHELKGHVTLIK